MATARTEKKTPSAKTAPKPESQGNPEATPAALFAGQYRDTGYEALVGKNGETVTAVMKAGEAFYSGLAEVSQEMMTFVGERLRQDLESVEDFATIKSPEEIFDKQMSFAQRAAQQYAEETSKLFAMMARIQQDCWKPVEERTKATLAGLNGDGKDAAKDEGGA